MADLVSVVVVGVGVGEGDHHSYAENDSLEDEEEVVPPVEEEASCMCGPRVGPEGISHRRGEAVQEVSPGDGFCEPCTAASASAGMGHTLGGQAVRCLELGFLLSHGKRPPLGSKSLNEDEDDGEGA